MRQKLSTLPHIMRGNLAVGNESVPKIIVNDTPNLFFKTAISILVISNHTSFPECCLMKLLPYILFEKYIYILVLETARPGNQHCPNCIGTLSFPMFRLFDRTVPPLKDRAPHSKSGPRPIIICVSSDQRKTKEKRGKGQGPAPTLLALPAQNAEQGLCNGRVFVRPCLPSFDRSSGVRRVCC